MQSLFTAIICICVIHHSFAQADSVNEISPGSSSLYVEYGFVHSRLIDAGYTDSRLMFRGTNSKFRLGYRRAGQRYIFGFTVEGSTGAVKSASGNLPSDLANLKAALHALRKIASHDLFGLQTMFFGGVQVTTNSYILGNQPVVDNRDIISINGVCLWASGKIQLTESQQLEMVYLIPAVSSIGRVINNKTNFTYESEAEPLQFLFDNSKTFYFNMADIISLRLEYETHISRHTSLGVRYGFFLLNNTFREPVRLYSNEILFGLKFNLK